MRRLTTTTGLRRHTRRAATMLEFAFVLPMFMFMLMFTLDMGHVVLMQGAVQDAAFSAARVGAQVGGAGIKTGTDGGSQVCFNNQPCSDGAAYDNLMQTAEQIPGYQADENGTGFARVTSVQLVSGSSCTEADDHVELKVKYRLELITPGLNAILALAGGAGGPDPHFTPTATAIARCEVVRG